MAQLAESMGFHTRRDPHKFAESSQPNLKPDAESTTNPGKRAMMKKEPAKKPVSNPYAKPTGRASIE